MDAQPDMQPELVKAFPGVLGAVVALRWISGTPLQKIASVIGGSGTSYYGGEYVASVTGANIAFTAWLLGLFGMAIAHRVFEFIASVDVGSRLDKLLTRWGL